MFGTCGDCGTFVRGGPCPHCGADQGLDGAVRLTSAAVLLLGLTALSGCPKDTSTAQPEYGAVLTDLSLDTGDTGE